MTNKNLFAMLDPNSTLEEINKFVQDIKNTVVAADEDDDNNAPSDVLKVDDDSDNEDEPENKEDIGVEEDPAPSISEKLDMMTQSIDQLSDYITKFQRQTDRTTIPVLQQIISAMDLNYKSAYELTTFYTKGWFSRSFMSLEGKAQFAAYLIATVTPFCKSNLETWQMIRDGDPEIKVFISWPRTNEFGS